MYKLLQGAAMMAAENLEEHLSIEFKYVTYLKSVYVQRAAMRAAENLEEHLNF